MKKSMILVGMLAIGYANAQEGKVGINTDAPKATIDISAYKTDGSTTEGLLIPRLSKEAIAKMTSPEKSTLVYVNDASYAGTEVTVANVSEEGFYHFNGTEWVRHLDIDDKIWVKDGADAKLSYPSSNYTIKYYSNGSYNRYYGDGKTESNTNLFAVNSMNREYLRSSDVNELSATGAYRMKYNIIDLNKDTRGDNYAYDFNTYITQDDILAGRTIIGLKNHIEHRGNSALNILYGLYSSSVLNSATGTSNSIFGGIIEGRVSATSTGEITDFYGTNNRVLVGGSGKITNIFGIRSNVAVSGAGTREVGNLYGVYSGYRGLSNANFDGTITNAYDFYAETNSIGTNTSGNAKVTNYYGVYIRGAQKNNFFAGNVGIGTDAPTAKFHLAGDMKLQTPPASWIGVRDSTAGINADRALTTSYHNFYRQQTIDGHYVAIGGNRNNFGFYSVLADRTENGIDHHMTMNAATGNVVIATTHAMQDDTVDNSKLFVEGKIKSTALAAVGVRPVYATATGVLTTDVSTAGAMIIPGTEGLVCNETNRGKMNFVKDITTTAGTVEDAFAVCLKASDNKYYWRYLYGAGGETNGTGAFGNGL